MVSEDVPWESSLYQLSHTGFFCFAVLARRSGNLDIPLSLVEAST